MKEVRELANALSNNTTSKVTTYYCIQWDNLVLCNAKDDKQSLLVKCKPYFAEIIAKLAHFRYFIAYNKWLELINSLLWKK